MLARLDFNSNPYLGVYCKANDSFTITSPFLADKEYAAIKDTLKADVKSITIGGSPITGSLLAMNSNGVVVTDFIFDNEAAVLKEIFDGNVLIINDKFNATGNNILANDYGALVHPMMSDETIKDIKVVLDVVVERGTIFDIQTVGMAAVATNKGVLCHPRIRDEEKAHIEQVLNVPAYIGTINHGVPYVGAGLVANAHGAIMGSKTTGIEMGRIEDALRLGE